MLGNAHAAGRRTGCVNADATADYFHVPRERLDRALRLLETSDRPEILLLQNPDPDANVSAATFFSSIWSNAYAKVGTPYGKVHRDFHYQLMFSALAALAETGCTRIQIANPMSGYLWRRDAYVCLLEATESVKKHLAKVAIHLEKDSYAPQMPKDIDDHMARYDLQEHRPVGIGMHIFEGLNMRTVFVEKARDALRAARGLSPGEADG